MNDLPALPTDPALLEAWRQWALAMASADETRLRANRALMKALGRARRRAADVREPVRVD